MKKLLSFLVVVLAFMPLFAKVTISESIPDDYHSAILLSLEENLRGRWSGDVFVDGSLQEEKGAMTLSIRLGEKTLMTEVRPENLGDEIEAMLFYEESLFASGDRLDYIHGSSFSALLGGKYSKGTELGAYDLNGDLRGLFAVRKNYREATVLTPLYLGDPKPGMELRKVSPMRLSGDLWSTVDFSSFIVDAKLSYGAPSYPVVPYVSASVGFGKTGSVRVGAGLGGEVSFTFASLWPEAPHLVTSSSLVAEVEADLWVGDLGLEFGGRYSISLETMVDGNFSMRFGVGELGYNSLGIMLGGGGRIL